MNDQLLLIGTIAATLISPLTAVIVTRLMDDRRTKQERRMSVFRDLMRTRRLQLSADHVSALNLVEIEFYREKSVLEAWKNYYEYLRRALPPNPSQEDMTSHGNERSKLLTKLLHQMAKSLKYGEFEQLEIFDGGYAPQGWADIESNQQMLRMLLLDLLSGKRALPVTTQVYPTAKSPYPPPPDTDSSESDVLKIKSEVEKND